MTAEKQSITVYLDNELMRLLQRWADKNRLTTVSSIESILKQYLVGYEDDVYQAVVVSDIQQRLETLEGKMLTIETFSQRQIETIEKLERQVAELEIAVENNDLTPNLFDLENSITEIKEELDGYWKKIRL